MFKGESYSSKTFAISAVLRLCLTRDQRSTAQSNRASVFGRAVDALLHRTHNHVSGFSLLFSVQMIELPVVSGTAAILFCSANLAKKKKDWNPPIVFSGCRQQVCERFVLALSLVLCQGNIVQIVFFSF